jgi:4-diphosphocytidyl-2-C-methyl-D-erythritol kinase
VPVTVRVPAKVNLALTVGPVRADGYHELATVFHAVSLHDTVVAQPRGPGEGGTVAVVGEAADTAGVPTGPDNLAARAAALLARRCRRPADVQLTLRKGIPVAGGMAGGSADAAATLVACDAMWGTRLDREALHDLAAELGCDVPFALTGGTAMGTGRGDVLSPALARGTYHWVIATADGGLATPAVYRELDRMRAGSAPVDPTVPAALMAALRSGDAVALGAALVNDLERAVISLRPALGLTLEVGLDAGALGAVISGSGPTCVFLVRDPEQGLDVAVSLTAAAPCRSVRRATGPVPGARVVGGP